MLAHIFINSLSKDYGFFFFFWLIITIGEGKFEL